MPAEQNQSIPEHAPRRRRIVVPKGFPGGVGLRPPGLQIQRSRASRLSGPVGAFVLHGALIAILFHVQTLREVFGQRPADEQEWTWLPEVTLVAQSPATPPAPPESEPQAETMVPIETVSEEAPPVTVPAPVPAPPTPAAEPPTPAPTAADAAATADSEAWTQVRRGIMKALRYPAPARRNGMAGVVVLRLRLDGAGRIVSAEIQPPAPAKPLCDAALAAVRRAGPFPAVGAAIRAGQTPDRAELAIRFQLDDPAP